MDRWHSDPDISTLAAVRRRAWRGRDHASATQPVDSRAGCGGGGRGAEVQFVSVFSAAIVADSEQVEAAKRLIAFLASPAADAALTNNGMERVR